MNAPITAWSYSRYADYTQCPFKFKCKYILKLPDPGSAAMDRGNKIHKLAEDYVKGSIKTLPPELKNFKAEFLHLRKLKPMVEQEWGFRSDWAHTGRPGWFGDDVWFRAKADVFVVYDDDTGDLIDHKTGKKYETNVDQIQLFTLAGFRRLPKLSKITTRLWYLDIADPKNTGENVVEDEFTAADAAALQKDWTKKVQPMFNDRKFPPRPNSKCGWCNYSKAKGGPCKF